MFLLLIENGVFTSTLCKCLITPPFVTKCPLVPSSSLSSVLHWFLPTELLYLGFMLNLRLPLLIVRFILYLMWTQWSSSIYLDRTPYFLVLTTYFIRLSFCPFSVRVLKPKIGVPLPIGNFLKFILYNTKILWFTSLLRPCPADFLIL